MKSSTRKCSWSSRTTEKSTIWLSAITSEITWKVTSMWSTFAKVMRWSAWWHLRTATTIKSNWCQSSPQWLISRTRSASSTSMDNASEADTAITSTPSRLADSLGVHSLDRCTMSTLNIRIVVALGLITEIKMETMTSEREETVTIMGDMLRRNRRRSTPADRDRRKNTRKTKTKRRRETTPNPNPSPSLKVLPGETTPQSVEHK